MAGPRINLEEELRLLKRIDELQKRLKNTPSDSEEYEKLSLELKNVQCEYNQLPKYQEEILLESLADSGIDEKKELRPTKTSTAGIILASIAGILVFLSVVILFTTLLSIIFALLMQIEIVAIVVDFFVRIPIDATLFASIDASIFICAYIVSKETMQRISKYSPIPLLVVGIVLLAMYIPSAILAIIAKSAIIVKIYGIIAGICFIKTSRN